MWMTVNRWLPKSKWSASVYSCPDGVVAEAMIEVGVRTQQVAYCQPVVVDIVDNSLTLLFEVGAAVDDDSLVAIVAYHVAVLLQHVDLESLDCYHRGR